MHKSIFNKGLKEIAKGLVASSGKHYSHTEALNIVAKMDGYDSYNKTCRISENTPRELEKLLNEKLEKIAPTWLMVKDLREFNFTNGNINSSLEFNEDNSKKIEDYINSVFTLVNDFFLFDDSSNIKCWYFTNKTNYKMIIEKLLIPTLDC